MTRADDPIAEVPYAWLDHRAHGPGPHMINATCLTYLAGVRAKDVSHRARLSDLKSVDLSDQDDPWFLVEDSAAVFELNDWGVIYQDNGFPEQMANRLCESADVMRAVVVFWNVDAAIEFSYWERGTLIAGFRESVDQRTGAEPAHLDADIGQVGLDTADSEEPGSVTLLYRRMLALADRLTGVQLPQRFLNRPEIIVGRVEE